MNLYRIFPVNHNKPFSQRLNIISPETIISWHVISYSQRYFSSSSPQYLVNIAFDYFVNGFHKLLHFRSYTINYYYEKIYIYIYASNITHTCNVIDNVVQLRRQVIPNRAASSSRKWESKHNSRREWNFK